MEKQVWIRAPTGDPYVPLKGQAEFHSSDAKYRAYIGGVGAGKSVCGCIEAVMTALTHPGSTGLVARYSWKELKSTTWDTLKRVAPKELVAGRIIENIHGFAMWLRTPTGELSQIIGWNGGNWKNLTGHNLDWFYIDEVTEWENDEVWKQLKARLRGPYGPRRGWATGTPNGRDWVWKRFVNSKNASYDYIRAKTEDNIHLPLGYAEDLRQSNSDDPDWVRRFLDAEFCVFEGMVFPHWDERIHVVEPFIPPAHWPLFVGIDPGQNDPCAALLGATDEDGNLFILREYYQKGKTISQQCEGILQMVGNVTISWAVIDSAVTVRSEETGRSWLELYRQNGIPSLQVASRRKEESYAVINDMMRRWPDQLHPVTREPGAPLIYIAKCCENLRREIGNHRFDLRGKPRDSDDHAISALRFIVMRRPGAAERPKVKAVNPIWAEFAEQLRREGGAELPMIGAGKDGSLLARPGGA